MQRGKIISPRTKNFPEAIPRIKFALSRIKIILKSPFSNVVTKSSPALFRTLAVEQNETRGTRGSRSWPTSAPKLKNSRFHVENLAQIIDQRLIETGSFSTADNEGHSPNHSLCLQTLFWKRGVFPLARNCTVCSVCISFFFFFYKHHCRSKLFLSPVEPSEALKRAITLIEF